MKAKMFMTMLVALSLQACGTVGGTLSGAGEDLRRAGEWVKSR